MDEIVSRSRVRVGGGRPTGCVSEPYSTSTNSESRSSSVCCGGGTAATASTSLSPSLASSDRPLSPSASPSKTPSRTTSVSLHPASEDAASCGGAHGEIWHASVGSSAPPVVVTADSTVRVDAPVPGARRIVATLASGRLAGLAARPGWLELVRGGRRRTGCIILYNQSYTIHYRIAGIIFFSRIHV